MSIKETFCTHQTHKRLKKELKNLDLGKIKTKYQYAIFTYINA